mmetsp:Transcript_76112/g.209986  ORF Transcript_76112/g.209986 Transcript_76112/m.209986 type:complete len:206 (+) Transcript_76112:69-686(+)
MDMGHGDGDGDGHGHRGAMSPFSGVCPVPIRRSRSAWPIGPIRAARRGADPPPAHRDSHPHAATRHFLTTTPARPPARACGVRARALRAQLSSHRTLRTARSSIGLRCAQRERSPPIRKAPPHGARPPPRRAARAVALLPCRITRRTAARRSGREQSARRSGTRVDEERGAVDGIDAPLELEAALDSALDELRAHPLRRGTVRGR